MTCTLFKVLFQQQLHFICTHVLVFLGLWLFPVQMLRKSRGRNQHGIITE